MYGYQNLKLLLFLPHKTIEPFCYKCIYLTYVQHVKFLTIIIITVTSQVLKKDKLSKAHKLSDLEVLVVRY